MVVGREWGGAVVTFIVRLTLSSEGKRANTFGNHENVSGCFQNHLDSLHSFIHLIQTAEEPLRIGKQNLQGDWAVYHSQAEQSHFDIFFFFFKSSGWLPLGELDTRHHHW